MSLKQPSQTVIVEAVLCDQSGYRNWQWLIIAGERALLIDPGYKDAIEAQLKRHRVREIAGIAITHDDHDHIAALDYYAEKYQAPVLRPQSEGSCSVEGFEFLALATPGHVRNHYSLLFTAGAESYLFAGDLLFVGGCGRVFTQDYGAMAASLQKLRELDQSDAWLCPGHAYAQANWAFIDRLGITNERFRAVRARARDYQEGDTYRPDVKLADELAYNPFLRWDDPEVLAALRRSGAPEPESPAATLRLLRQLKESS